MGPHIIINISQEVFYETKTRLFSLMLPAVMKTISQSLYLP